MNLLHKASKQQLEFMSAGRKRVTSCVEHLTRQMRTPSTLRLLGTLWRGTLRGLADNYPEAVKNTEAATRSSDDHGARNIRSLSGQNGRVFDRYQPPNSVSRPEDLILPGGGD